MQAVKCKVISSQGVGEYQDPVNARLFRLYLRDMKCEVIKPKSGRDEWIDGPCPGMKIGRDYIIVREQIPEGGYPND